ncbi:hypothetical protein PT974_09681 [Cladobotryum mycophilum]|uniref:Uncharacterized protein n=1 Tax=Cladobotryum mycophilum TaxID=491253 RepID=A0ABR0SI13_9HYPO
MSEFENFEYRVFSITTKTHNTAYPAISPSRPDLSQAGRTVLITGGTGGIGYATAQSFSLAGAEKVIIVGRDEAKTKAAVLKLTEEAGSQSRTNFEGRVCQLSSPDSIESLWDVLAKDGIHVDVLVLNAAATGSSSAGMMWNLGWKHVWGSFEINVRSTHHFAERFWKQPASAEGKKKYLINVSTSAIHDWQAGSYIPAYGLTKNSGTLLFQQLARETPVAEMQIVSLHPGAVLSPGAREAGFDETSIAWDDVDLSASAAVWAASDEAAFLHGRFIWSAWDVEELKDGELRKRIEDDDKFLRIGVHGL